MPFTGAVHFSQMSGLCSQPSELVGQSSSVGRFGLAVAPIVEKGTGTPAVTAGASVHSFCARATPENAVTANAATAMEREAGAIPFIFSANSMSNTSVQRGPR